MPARKRRSSKSKKTPTRIRLLAAVLILVAAGGVFSVKLLESTWGHVVLVDSGFADYYWQVQEELDLALRNAMADVGLEDGMKTGSQGFVIGRKKESTRTWDATCKTSCSFVQINLELTKAVRGTGAVIRSSVEMDDGQTLVFEAGTRKYATHRVRIRQSREPQIVVAKPKKKPKVAIVIDDFGYSKSQLVEDFLAIDLPLTIAVIPSLRHSRYTISKAHEKNKEVILHVPMEALSYDSDIKTVSETMTSQEIVELLKSYFKENPGVIGVNNHLGSRATQNPRVMEAVLGVVKSHNLFFLDSLTSRKSIAYNTAKTLGVETARNDVFVDANTEDPKEVEARFMRLLRLAKRRGHAVGIGHPKPWTFQAIAEIEDVLKGSEIELVFVSTLVE